MRISVRRKILVQDLHVFGSQALLPSRPLTDRDGVGEVNEEEVNEEVSDLHVSGRLSCCDARKYFSDRPYSDAGLCLC